MEQPSFENQKSSMQTVFLLIGLCIAGFILQLIANPNQEMMFALSRNGVIEHHRFWQVVTYAFMHGDFFHILFNMWGLYLFGSMIAPVMNSNRILFLFFISAVTGGLLFIATNPVASCVGASGAVCGMTAAAAMINPKAKILLIFAPTPISMKAFFWIFLLISALFAWGSLDNIAHLAHIGGVFGGYIYIRIMRLGTWDPFGALIGKPTITPAGVNPSSNPYRNPEAPFTGSAEAEPINSREVDRLLDKISRSGVNSLSEAEYDLLRRARDRFKRN